MYEFECWATIPGYPNYQVSTHGRVRNKRNGYILKPTLDKDGYPRLSLGNADNLPIHRLACETFYGPAPDDKYHVNHIDANRQNNHILNLEWCSPRENVMWGYRKGNIDPNIGIKKAREANLTPVRIVELDMIFPSVKDCAAYLGVPATNVSRVLKGYRRGQYLHGYTIEYIGGRDI